MGILIFGIVFMLVLVGYAVMSVIDAEIKWNRKGYRDAMVEYGKTGKIPGIPEPEGKNLKKELVSAYREGFAKAVAEISARKGE